MRSELRSRQTHKIIISKIELEKGKTAGRVKFPSTQRQLSFVLTKAEQRRVDDGILPVELFRFLPAEDSRIPAEEEEKEEQGTRRSRGGSRKGNRVRRAESNKSKREAEAVVVEGAEGGGRESTPTSTTPLVADESGSVLGVNHPLGNQRNSRRAGERRIRLYRHTAESLNALLFRILLLPGFCLVYIYTYKRLSVSCVHIYNRASFGRNAIPYIYIYESSIDLSVG